MALSRLQSLEKQQQFGLYQLIYSNAGSKEVGNMMYAQARLLINERGVFRLEQQKKDPQRNFWVYFDPDKEIVVVFPKLQTAYKASSTILAGDDGEKVVAIYDGLRMILGFSEVWTQPEANGVDPKSGGTISVSQQDRPYRWSVDVSAGGYGNPIQSMTAKKGWRKLVDIERKTSSIQEFDQNNDNSFREGKAGKSSLNFQWAVSLAGHDRISDFVFTPYPIAAGEKERIMKLFGPPELDKSFSVQELTLDMIMDWLALR